MKFIILREETSSRGGGIEIDLTPHGYEGEKMTAYQNYLGGGMLGKIANSCTIQNFREDKKLVEVADKLARHFNSIANNSDEDFEEIQKRPLSAY